jgi:hypothetical protein
MRITITLALAAVLAAGLTTTRAEDELAIKPATFSFLTGDWVQQTKGQTTEEHWIGPVGGVMAGITLNHDASVSAKTSVEFMSIEMREGRYTFIARLGDDPPVGFPLKEADNGLIVFENPAHDFPQRIIYSFDPAEDALDARIEGTMDGKAQSMSWHYTRMKK